MRTAMLACTLIVATAVCMVHAHSHLANPLPTRQLDCRAGNFGAGTGRRHDCFGPCPALDNYGRPTGITASRPAATWRRGERRWVSWHRNNHGHGESGFVRFSLVPVSQMFKQASHERFAFHTACWSSGLHRCSSRNANVCGNDAGGMAYRVAVTVPTSYPDGVYAFGWAWYGGGDFRGNSFFGDYFSCSFVRIRGGVGVTDDWKPVFQPGIDEPYEDACLSATDRIGVCAREPCRGHVVRPLRPSRVPRGIYARDLGWQGGSAGGKSSGGLGFGMVGMEILDVATMRATLVSGTRFRVQSKKHSRGFTLAARTWGNVRRVVFEMTKYQHTEYHKPYVLNGDDGRLRAVHVCAARRPVAIRVLVYGLAAAKEMMYTMDCA